MATLIQNYITAMVKKMQLEAQAVGSLDHRLTKGQYREVFVQSLLQPLLMSQFGIGSGIIVNQRGDQSPQQDIVIYDRRVLPPFLAVGNQGVFPIESVLGTVEVKSRLTKAALVEADEAAVKVKDLASSGSMYGVVEPPLAAIIGFDSDGFLSSCDAASCDCLGQLKCIWQVCCVGRFSWLKQNDWQITCSYDCLETKLFIAVMLDNIRTRGEKRYLEIIQASDPHRDWFSAYLREDSSAAMHLAGSSTSRPSATTPPGDQSAFIPKTA